MTKHKKALKFTEIFLISFVWLVLISAPILFSEDENNFSMRSIMRPMVTLIPMFIIFIINRLVLVPQLLFKRGALSYVISVAGLIAIITAGSYYYQPGFGQGQSTLPGRYRNQKGPEALNPPPERAEFNRKAQPGQQGFLTPPPEHGANKRQMPPYANLLIFSLLMVGFDTGLRVSFRFGETEQARTRLEKENIETQLAFLRNQVSPHFFMNTLNNIHSLIDIDSEEAKKSIIHLSKLMRHLLYESEIERIPIQKEIDFIKNYINLMKLRYTDKVKISLNLPSQLPDKTIPPLLFTSYLENAFKHGISYEKTSIIDITFSFTKYNLTFEIQNSKQEKTKDDEPSGIGIENSRKRLDLIYGDNYLLKIDYEKDEHTVSLTIPI